MVINKRSFLPELARSRAHGGHSTAGHIGPVGVERTRVEDANNTRNELTFMVCVLSATWMKDECTLRTEFYSLHLLGVMHKHQWVVMIQMQKTGTL